MRLLRSSDRHDRHDGRERPRPQRRPAALLGVGALVLAATLAGCGGDSDDGAGEDSGDDQTLTVLAAASLTESFTELGKQFEADHPGVTVKFAFDSSATLAGQAAQGAPADVLATADTRTMQDAVDADAIDGDPQTFATNTTTLVVPADNPADIEQFSDIDADDVTYVVCVEDAPCGATAAALLEEDGIANDPASLEVDVKAVLQKVTSDQADAGIVYESDAVAAGDDVQQVDIPGAADALQDYPIGPLVQAQDSDLAQEWIDLVLSADGQEVLNQAGFGSP